MNGRFTSAGVIFDWIVHTDLGPTRGWTLVVVAGDVSVARRYPQEPTEAEMGAEAAKVGPLMLTLIDQWFRTE